jgi:hypothetical protein
VIQKLRYSSPPRVPREQSGPGACNDAPLVLCQVAGGLKVRNSRVVSAPMLCVCLSLLNPESRGDWLTQLPQHGGAVCTGRLFRLHWFIS